jgi:hypothetical protein
MMVASQVRDNYYAVATRGMTINNFQRTLMLIMDDNNTFLWKVQIQIPIFNMLRKNIPSSPNLFTFYKYATCYNSVNFPCVEYNWNDSPFL